MFRVKVCGITSVADACAVAAAGADAVGLNFYARSPRYIEPLLAQQIAGSLPPHIVRVGVFVNSSIGDVCATYDRLGLDLIQLHGDEPPEFIRELEGRPVLRAFRCAASLEPVGQYLDRCADLACMPRMVLIDAYQSGHYGGTGKLADWSLLDAGRGALGELPLVWAGGLTPENVAAAVARVRPAAVDVASGVESSPGRKSPPLVKAFVEAARGAFDALGRAAS
jgi:phosphoribosylanthranilate isomerase